MISRSTGSYRASHAERPSAAFAADWAEPPDAFAADDAELLVAFTAHDDDLPADFAAGVAAARARDGLEMPVFRCMAE